MTLPAILRIHGYEVSVAASVPEALQAIQLQKYDVLVSDLNIGQPGDGFTVVSAMRRTQPEAVTIILTGFPAFESALEAIRSQVDDYIVKPANVEALVSLIERKLLTESHAASRPDKKHISDLLREKTELIAERWSREMSQDTEFTRLGLDGSEHRKHLAEKIHLVSAMLEGRNFGDDDVASAREYGQSRSRQMASLALVLEEARITRRVILGVIQENLLSVNVSRVINEIIDISEWLDRMNEHTVESYTQACKAQQAG
jgi:YesN/AraC family two-component response regulator